MYFNYFKIYSYQFTTLLVHFMFQTQETSIDEEEVMFYCYINKIIYNFTFKRTFLILALSPLHFLIEVRKVETIFAWRVIEERIEE